MEAKIAELCEIESGLYLDYYNGKYTYKQFHNTLESEKQKIIDLVYDLLEEGYEDTEILSAIKEQGEFYKESPEWFSNDADISNYPSEYFETDKSKKYPFHEKCGHTLSLVKRFFKIRKSIKVEHAYQKSKYNNLDDGMREMIYTHMRAMKKKKKKKKKNTKRRKRSKNKSKKKKNK